MGNKKNMQKIKKDLIVSPLTLCGELMKEKVCDKYLGDFIHSEGCGASVHCTIYNINRYGRTMSGIIEIRTIVDDCRINTVGGL